MYASTEGVFVTLTFNTDLVLAGSTVSPANHFYLLGAFIFKENIAAALTLLPNTHSLNDLRLCFLFQLKTVPLGLLACLKETKLIFLPITFSETCQNIHEVY